MTTYILEAYDRQSGRYVPVVSGETALEIAVNTIEYINSLPTPVPTLHLKKIVNHFNQPKEVSLLA